MANGQTRLCAVLFGAALCVVFASPVFAQTLESDSYRFDESTIGQGGLPLSESTNYQGSSSTGDLGVGEAFSGNYGFQGGSQTTDAPRLAVAVTSGPVTFPTFSPTTPSMATATFEVLNYTSYGYNVFITGNPPTNHSGSGHTIQPMNDLGASSPGFEQFGMNLVANTTPQVIGADPDNGPYGFAYGGAGDVEADGIIKPLNNNYKLNGQFKYSDGDLIASAVKSGSYTNYTITYLINVGHLTPGGQYTSNLSIVVVGTY